MKENKTPEFNVRRELVKLECQDCGADLEMLDETYAYCKHCGQKYIVNVLLERISDIPIEEKKENQKVKTNNTEKQNVIVSLVVAAGVICLLIGCIFLNHKETDSIRETDSFQTNETQYQESDNKGTGGIYFITSEKKEEPEDWEGFRSQMMQQIVSIMFGKPANEVTEEELMSIRYLKVDVSLGNDYCGVSYSTADYREYPMDFHNELPGYTDSVDFAYSKAFEDTIQRVYVPFVQEDYAYVYGDVRNFSNVNSLCLDYFRDVDFTKMPNLTMLDAGSADISELLEAGIPVEQIEVLKIDRCDLTGIEQFTSLKQLYVEYLGAEYMNELVKCTNLDTLYCVNCFGTASYTPLKELTGLKTLYIDGASDGVKDLSVIASFGQLENLSITDTDILRLDFVKDLKNLKTLRLSENDELENFDGLGNLQSLEALVVDIYGINYDNPVHTDIGKLKNLKTLILASSNQVDFLYELNQLEKLVIQSVGDKELLAPISKMPNLKELSLIRCNTWNWEDEMVSCLKDLSQLKVLKVQQMEFEGAADAFFELDTLEELCLVNCTFEVPPKQIKVSDKFKVLDLRGTEFKNYYYSEEPYVGQDEESIAQGVLKAYCEAPALEELYLDSYEMVDLLPIRGLDNLKILSLRYCELTEVTEMDFDGCQTLEELKLSHNQVSDISFVRNLPNLKRLELQDCYVTDLSPLLSCPRLFCVDVSMNPIANNPLEDVVWVISD